MHRGGSARVIFDIRSQSEADGTVRVSVHSFQLDSLAVYVNRQPDVRDALEQALCKDRADWLGIDVEGRAGLHDTLLWEQAQIKYLLLSPRNIDTSSRDALKDLNFEEADIDEIAAMSDTPDTRSTFTIAVEVSWDEEHRMRTALFRDGELVHLGLEG
jgi:hypothetical protein